MRSRNIGLILAVIGIIVVIVVLLADTLSIGLQPGRFGTQQIVGLVVGVVLVIVGIVLFRRTGQGAPPA
jgi:hypothetical protein